MKLFINSFRSWIAWATVAMLLLSVVWTYILLTPLTVKYVSVLKSLIIFDP